MLLPLQYILSVGITRKISTCLVNLAKRNHYNSLGITPKATQADIKSAYYELSKVYHPDRNQGSEENLQKFRDVTEAYEVLGNVRTRKLYDRGMYHSATQKEEDEDPLAKFYKSREHRSRAPPPSGRTPIYDFDEWSRQHYGATLRRDFENKRRVKMYNDIQMQHKQEMKIERVMFGMGIVLMFFIALTNWLEEDYDNVRENQDNSQSRSNDRSR